MKGPLNATGRATCLALASLGCSIAIHYNSSAETATELVKQVEAKGVKAKAFQAALSDYGGVRKLHREVFNNAGTTSDKANIKDVKEISVEVFEQTWRANCGTAFLLTQLCLPSMESTGWGRVIFCSSVAGFTGV